MNILQVINALTWGGAQTLLLDLCRFLREQGHTVTVASFRDGPLGDRFREAGIPVLLLEERWFDLPGYWQLCHWIKNHQPDLIHTHLFRASFWARLASRAKPGIPVLTSVHGMESARSHGIEKHTAHWSRVLVFPSEYLRSWYEHSIRPLSPQHGKIISPGTPVFPLEENRPAHHPVRIGTLSRLHPVKGLDRLLDALHILHQQGVPFELVIGGDGKDRLRLEELTRKHALQGNVHFIGPVLDSLRFLEGLDIFCASSREEAFGINACEAMERGLPTVAADVGGLREIVEPGKSGILLPGEKPEDWAEVFKNLIADPTTRGNIGRQGRQKIIESFDRRLCHQGYLQLMAGLVNPRIPAATIQVAISSCELGGGERLALGLAEEFHQKGWKVQALCTGSPLREAFSSAGIPVETVSARAGGLFFGARLLRCVSQAGRGLVHAHLNRAALMAGFIGSLLRRPTIAHVHGLNRSVYYRWCQRLIAVSCSVAEHLKTQGLPAAAITMLPNAIAPARLSEQPEPPAPPPWRIGIVAKLHANKGHDWALQAFENSRDRLPPFQILIFGDGPARAQLENKWKQSPLGDQIRFFGFQQNMEVHYPSLHLSLLPSLSEGIPLSLLESLRHGIPVVATRIGGIPEIIEDGINGLLVPPLDAKALTTALQRLMQPDTHVIFRREARASFERHNPFTDLLNGTELLYREALASASP